MRSMVLVALALTGVAFSESTEPLDPGAAAGAYLSYGAPLELGKGKARAYVVRNQKTGHPVEVGVALTEGALEGLPQTGAHGGNGHEHYASYILELPADHGTPYRFVELDWNPKGHGGPYTARHFDVHFYRISLEEHDAIDPARADYAQQASAFPHRDSISGGTSIPVPAAGRYVPAGFYMDSYRVSFDRASGEYRVALTGLAWRE
jgi:hypothetical protein